jgi:hypothetical protein
MFPKVTNKPKEKENIVDSRFHLHVLCEFQQQRKKIAFLRKLNEDKTQEITHFAAIVQIGVEAHGAISCCL